MPCLWLALVVSWIRQREENKLGIDFIEVVLVMEGSTYLLMSKTNVINTLFVTKAACVILSKQSCCRKRSLYLLIN